MFQEISFGQPCLRMPMTASMHLSQYGDLLPPSGPVLILAFRSLNFPVRKCCVKRLLLQFAAKGLAYPGYQRRAFTKLASDTTKIQ